MKFHAFFFRQISTLLLSVIFIFCLSLSFYGCSNQKNKNFIINTSGQKIIVEDSTSSFEIEVYQKNLFKISYHHDKSNPVYERSFAIGKLEHENVDLNISEYSDSVEIDAGGIKMIVYNEPFSFSFFKDSGEPILDAIDINKKGEGHIVRFQVKENDRFFGMGQKSISIDRKGHRFGTTNIHMGGYTKPYATQQVNIPYIYSPVGYGVLFDNTWPGTFDLGATKPEVWSYEASNGSFTFYVSEGENLQQLQKNYYDLTGYPPLPPKWSLGLLQSKCGYENENVVDSIVNIFEKKQMPLDAIILDAYWFGGYKEGYPNYMGNFSWLKSNFPDHKAYLRKMSEKGIKTILISEPYINLDSKNYDFLADNGLLVSEKGKEEPYVISPYWAGDASMLDITHPKAQEWMWEQFHRLLAEGVDGLWIDLTEPEYVIEGGEFHLGPEKKVHNVYNNIFAETIYGGWRNDFPDKRVFNLTRAGFAGIQRFGAINWSGDASKTWIALKLQVPMLIGCAMSGMPHFSSDIGGFTNAHDRTDGMTIFTNFNGKGVLTTPELYVRWFQFGVFSPMLRPHSGEEQYCEPFAHGPEAEKITSFYLDWRYRFIPYVYSYAHQTTQASEQLIKPLFMLFNDVGCDTVEYQYMFGDELMAAPVVEEGKRTKEVYFPELEDNYKWIDFWNDKAYKGGDVRTVPAALSEFPLFARQPSIIPLGKIKKHTGSSADDTLFCRVYPGGGASFTLYEDDGESYAYENGAYSKTDIQTDYNQKKLSITVSASKGSFEGMLESRHWVFDIRLIESFQEILVNGQLLKENEYRFDAPNERLLISTEAAVSKDVNIEIMQANLIDP